MVSYGCECGMPGCKCKFESDKYWEEGDAARVSENQIILHIKCIYTAYFEVVKEGKNFTLVKDI
jgi:hypothetical protein